MNRALNAICNSNLWIEWLHARYDNALLQNRDDRRLLHVVRLKKDLVSSPDEKIRQIGVPTAGSYRVKCGGCLDIGLSTIQSIDSARLPQSRRQGSGAYGRHA